MKKLINVAIVSGLLTLTNCGGSEGVEVDCSESDLSVDVVNFEKSDCDVPGSVTLQANGGGDSYQFSLDGESFQTSEDFNNLFAGNFTFVVRDNLGCTASVDFNLESEPTGITVNLTGTATGCATNSGTITVGASGGVGDLQYSLDGGAFVLTSDFSSIAAGNHSITVRDEESCEVTKTIKILTTTSLSTDIMPIIMSDCAITSCHNGTQSPRLSTKSQVIQNASRIRSETQAGSMPRDRTLTQEEIDLIACWVDDGALDN